MNPLKEIDILSLIVQGVAVPLINAVMDISGEKDRDYCVDETARLLSISSENINEFNLPTAMSSYGLLAFISRLSLLSLSCQVMGSFYSQSGEMPRDADIKRIVSSVNSLLAMPGSLDCVRSGGMGLSYFNGYGPLLIVANGFSFGQDEGKLIQDVSKKIEVFVDEGIEKLSCDNTENRRQLLRSVLITLYCGAHSSEVRRIMALEDYQRDQEKSAQHLENTWRDFEIRAEMMMIIAQAMCSYDVPDIHAFKTMHEDGDLDFLDSDNLFINEDKDEADFEGKMIFYKRDAANQAGPVKAEKDPMSFYKAK